MKVSDILITLMVLLLVMNASVTVARADTFEFLTFTPPKGWAKESLPDGIAYRRPDGIGLIAVYASYQNSGSPSDEFANVWRTRVKKLTQAAAPQPQIQQEGDFRVAIGAQRVSTKDGITAVSLATFVGRGRSLSVLAISVGDSVQNEITLFLDGVSILPSTAVRPNSNTLGIDVDFAAPPGYVSEQDTKMVVLKPTVINEQTSCIYAIGTARPSRGNLEADALAAVLEPLPGWQLKGERYDAFRGISDAGWQYFAIRTDVQMLINGSYQYLSAVSLAFPAAAGNVNIAWGFGSLSHCTGEELAFVRLFHSLRPRGVATDGGKAFAKEFSGIWQNSQNVGLRRYKFLPNGRYESGQATSTTFGNLETRNSSVTDGGWSLNGSELTIKSDRRDIGSKKYRVRIFERNTGGRWWRMMFLLDEKAQTRHWMCGMNVSNISVLFTSRGKDKVRKIKMKMTKIYPVYLIVMITIAASQQSFAQLTDFYTSPGYSTYINDLITNSIWNSSMKNYTKNYKGSSTASRSRSSTPTSSSEIPAYRKYPAVQFKSTGTRLTLQEYLDSVKASPQEKAEIKELVLKIFKEYEAEAAAKGYPNDWALAFVSYVGLNSHIYNGKTEDPTLPFEQNIGLRDVVAEYATDHGIFNNVTDRQKQELYELMVMLGGLTYHFYEKALRENNAEDLKDLKLGAAQNLKLVGVKP